MLTNIFGDVRSKPAIEYIPWFWQTGLIYTFLMMLGGAYNVYEAYINRILNKKIIITCMFTAFIALTIIQMKGFEFFCLGLSGKSNILGITTIILSLLLLIFFVKQITPNKITNFIGKQSIAFYFLSGAIPATILAGFEIFQLEKSYIILIAYILISLTTSYIATYIVTKFLPFLLDIRILFKKK